MDMDRERQEKLKAAAEANMYKASPIMGDCGATDRPMELAGQAQSSPYDIITRKINFAEQRLLHELSMLQQAKRLIETASWDALSVANRLLDLHLQ